MAFLWGSGFESNTTGTTEWDVRSGTGTTVQSTIVNGGSFASRVTSLVSGTAQGWLHQLKGSASNGPFFIAFYVYFATLPTAENTIFSLVNGITLASTAGCVLTVDSGGVLRLYQDQNAAVVGSASAAAATNTWHLVEVWYDRSLTAGSQVLKARLNGTEFASSSSLTIANQVISVVVGANLDSEAQTTGDWYFDDIAVNDNTGSFQNTYPGAGKIVHMHPTGAGDNTGWGLFAGTPNWNAVSEVTPDGNTSAVQSKVTGTLDDYALTADSSIGVNDTIQAVAVGAYWEGTGATSNSTFALRLKATSGGTVSESSTVSPGGTGYVVNASTPHNYLLVSYQQPGTSNAWTQAVLSTAQIGLHVILGSTNNVRVSTVWLVVRFTPGTATAAQASILTASPGAAWHNRFRNERPYDLPIYFNAVASPIPATATLQDDFKFDDGIDSYKWTNGGGNNIQVQNIGAEVNHQLVLQSTLAANYFTLTSVSIYDLGGSYLFAQLTSAGNQTITSFEVYPVLIQDSIQFANQIWIMVSGGTVFAKQKISGATTTIGSIAYNSATMVWFRLREQSGILYFEYSADCVAWTQFASQASPMQVNSINASVQIGTWQAEANTTTAQITNLNVAPGSLQTSWSGFIWNKRVKLGASMFNHQFLASNVGAPDASGYLTLSISNPTGNSPYGAEIYTDNKNFGYGKYLLTTNTELDNLDYNIVFGGMFPFDYQAPPDYKEIDVNELRWNAGTPAQLFQSHAFGAGPSFISNIGTVNPAVQQTFRLIWGPDGLIFDAYVGADDSGTSYQHAYQTTNLPSAGSERVHINIWIQTVSNPSVVQPVNVQLQSFTYIPNAPVIGSIVSGKTWARKFAFGTRRTYYAAVRNGGNVYLQTMTGGLSYIGTYGPTTTTKPLNAAVTSSGAANRLTNRTQTATLSSTGSTTKTTARTIPASLSFTGALSRAISYPLTAALNFTGSFVRTISHSIAATLSFTGSITKKYISAGFSAAISFAGSLIGSRLRLLSLTGALSFIGSQTKSTAHNSTAAVSFTGNNTKRTARSQSASLSFSGNLNRATARALAATISFVGSVTKAIAYPLTAAVSFIGSVTKRTSKTLAAAVSFTGSIARSTVALLSAAVSFSGSITRAITYPLSGALSFSGTLAKRTARAYAATVSFSGSIAKAVARSLVAAAVSFTGTVTKSTGKAVSASLSFSGSVAKLVAHKISAALSFIGNLIASPSHGGTQFTQSLVAALSFTGSQIKQTAKTQAANLSFSGALSKVTARALTASLNFIGSLSRVVRHTLSAAVSFSGAIARNMPMHLAAVLSFTGSIGRRIPRSFTGNLTLSGSFSKSTSKLLAASLSFTTTMRRAIAKGLTAAITFAGALITSGKTAATFVVHVLLRSGNAVIKLWNRNQRVTLEDTKKDVRIE